MHNDRLYLRHQSRSPIKQLMIQYYRPALYVQFLYAFLVIIWNAVGLWQRSEGLVSIGPTASTSVIAFALTLVVALYLLVNVGAQKFYMMTSLVILVVASLAIFSAFTKDLNLWTSEFWRWAGVLINSIGVASFFLAVKIYKNNN